MGRDVSKEGEVAKGVGIIGRMKLESDYSIVTYQGGVCCRTGRYLPVGVERKDVGLIEVVNHINNQRSLGISICGYLC